MSLRSILFALAAICIRGDLRQMEHEEMMVKMKQAYPSLANTISAVSGESLIKEFSWLRWEDFRGGGSIPPASDGLFAQRNTVGNLF